MRRHGGKEGERKRRRERGREEGWVERRERMNEKRQGRVIEELSQTKKGEEEEEKRERTTAHLLFSSLVSPKSPRSKSGSPSSGAFRAGWVLNRLATKARFRRALPLTTSFGRTNLRQPILCAWFNILSALLSISDS